MRKTHLDFDKLQVTSFATTAERGPARGTVHGQDAAAFDVTTLTEPTAASACSWTNGVYACKSCGPCCQTL
jgi:hypothetical protein